MKEGLEANEVGDWMRGLGFFPSDYEIECLLHELEICGKRKVPFEDLLKLYVNHSNLIPRTEENGSQRSFESSLRVLIDSPNADAMEQVSVNKTQLITVMTESAEKVDAKKAESYLTEIFHKENEIPLREFMHRLNKISREISCCGT